MNEFEIIARLFAPLARSAGAAGLRDDAAELTPLPSAGARRIVTVDALVEGVHFLSDDPLDSVARKLVRVNVSDIVAKGGRPEEALLTLVWPASRPVADLERFAPALGDDLALWGAHLIGGDTTSTPGPLTLSLTLFGACGAAGPVRRNGAAPGQDVWVTGEIGDAGLGLRALRGELGELSAEDREHLVSCYRVPRPPPVDFAAIVAAYATASVDVSDGLLADAGWIARESGVGLVIDPDSAPLSLPALTAVAAGGMEARLALLTAGDDYQTLFTAEPESRALILARASAIGLRITRLGVVEAGAGVRLPGSAGVGLPGGGLPAKPGWRHF